MEENISVKKSNIWKYATFAIIAIIAIGIFMFASADIGAKDNQTTGNAVNIDGNVQKVKLGIKDNNYYPNTIRVKSGQPVSITLDSSVQGCLRSFVIKDLGVQGYSKEPSQTIDFTPTQKGTFRFACSMGMGYGTIIVE